MEVMGLLTGHASDLLLLAEDEARMLGRSVVEPEHVLLALSRHGRGRDLLAQGAVSSRDLHEALLGAGGMGDELVLGRLKRSQACKQLLERAVAVAAARGEGLVDELHLLIALPEHERVRGVLESVGVDDLAGLVDERYRPRRRPLTDAELRSVLVGAALEDGARQGRAAVPAFERFTGEARRAIRAGAETAAQLEHREVDPFHLLLGCLQVTDSYAGQIIASLWADGELGAIGEAIDLAKRVGPHPFHQATGLFSQTARRVVAEDALKLAYRHGHAQIGTGHLLLAVLDSHDPTTLAMTRPHTERLARTLARGLPGGEHDTDDDRLEWIQLDLLIQTMTLGFRRVLPPGWTIHGSARSDIHLRVPDSRSESDVQIRPGWIVAQTGTATHRLQRITVWMLEQLQDAIGRITATPWPATADNRPAPAHAQLIPDHFNPRLRVGYGDPQSPLLRVAEPDLLVNMLISTS